MTSQEIALELAGLLLSSSFHFQTKSPTPVISAGARVACLLFALHSLINLTQTRDIYLIQRILKIRPGPNFLPVDNCTAGACILLEQAAKINEKEGEKKALIECDVLQIPH